MLDYNLNGNSFAEIYAVNDVQMERFVYKLFCVNGF